METKVVHCKKSDFDVYIGRPSIYGNPYSHKEHSIAQQKVPDVETAILYYRQHLLRESLLNPMFFRAIMALEGKVLGCWCKPKACHGDVIVQFINEINLTCQSWQLSSRPLPYEVEKYLHDELVEMT